jgi:hypothetical protein
MTFKYLLTSAVFAALVVLSASAQTNKPLGTVGNKPIDKALLQNITNVYLHLQYTEDTALVRSYVSKYYAKQLIMADSVKKLPAYDSLKPIIEDLRKMVEAKVLAEYYQNQLLDKACTPTEKEINDYYNHNKDRYKTIPVYSFFQAYTASDDKTVEDDIKTSMQSLYKQAPEQYGTSKKTGANYTLNFENKLMMMPTYSLYEPLKNSKPGQIAGPFTLTGRKEKVYLLVTYAEPEVVKPLSEVKTDIVNVLRISKREAMEKAVTDKANSQYPISFK